MRANYLAYGALGFALSVVGIPLFIYLPTYYASDIGVDVATVGWILLIARLVDMLFDPIIGHYSDRFQQRKPFIVIGAIALLVGYYLLIHPIANPPLWLFVFSMMVYLGWSLISVPYMALSSEITTDYHEKTALSSWREIFALLGMISALIIPYVLDISNRNDLTLQSLYLLLLISLPLTLAWLMVGVKTLKIPTQNFNFFGGITLIKQSNGVWLVAAYFINALANAIPSTLFLYYVEHILHASEQSGLLLLLYFAAGILSLPLWNLLSHRIGKKTTWILSMALASVAFAFIPLLGEGDFAYFMIIVLVSGCSLGADLVLSSSLQADLAQHFTQKGSSLSGILFGLWGMGTKLALALGVGISFGILGYCDFDPISPSERSLDALILLYGLSPIVFKILSVTLLSRYKETN